MPIQLEFQPKIYDFTQIQIDSLINFQLKSWQYVFKSQAKKKTRSKKHSASMHTHFFYTFYIFMLKQGINDTIFQKNSF